MSQNLYLRIRSAIFKEPWAILPARLDVILAYLEARANGVHADAITDALRGAEKQAAQTRATLREQGVAVIPVGGTITHRASGIDAMSGRTTSSRDLVEKTREALGDNRVGAVIHHYNSPGGTVSGVPEAAADIRAMRGDKPIVAMADTMMASAAYWLGSAADEIAVTPSGDVGSIGVFAVHEDFSEQYARLGEHYTLVASAPHKGEGLDFLPMTDEYRSHLEDQVLAYDDMFVKDVAKNRGVTEKTVRQDFGEGRMVLAKQAVKVGLADRVETFDQTVNRLIAGCGRKRRRRAMAVVADREDRGWALDPIDEARLAMKELEEAVESGNSDLIDGALANAEQKADALCITEREAEDCQAGIDAAYAALAGLHADTDETDVTESVPADTEETDATDTDTTIAARNIEMRRRRLHLHSV